MIFPLRDQSCVYNSMIRTLTKTAWPEFDALYCGCMKNEVLALRVICGRCLQILHIRAVSKLSLGIGTCYL